MSDILLIGKDLPDSLNFAKALSQNGHHVFTNAKSEADAASFESENIFAAVWGRNSAISARSFIIRAETRLQDLTDYVIVFDSLAYGQKFELDRSEDISYATDYMISSYQYLVNELLFRLEQKQEPATITFLVRTYPSKFEVLTNGNRNVNLHPTSNIVNSAQNAFISLAENISTLVSDKSYLSVLLAKCSPSNELFNSENELGKWVLQSIETIKGQKNKQTVKQAANWIKAGGKVGGGFPFFK